MHHECEIFVFFRNSFHTIFPLLSRKWTLLGISICCRHFLPLSLPSWPNMYYFEPLRISIQLSQQQISQGTLSFKTRKKAKLKKTFPWTQNCFQTLQAIRETQGANHRSLQESEQSWGKPHQIPTDLQDQILKCGEMLWRFVNFLWCKLSVQINVKHFIYRKDVCRPVWKAVKVEHKLTFWLFCLENGNFAPLKLRLEAAQSAMVAGFWWFSYKEDFNIHVRILRKYFFKEIFNFLNVEYFYTVVRLWKIDIEHRYIEKIYGARFRISNGIIEKTGKDSKRILKETV